MMDTRSTILCGLLAFPAILAAVLVWIQIQDRRVRSWRQATGRIVSSKPVARTIRTKRHRTSGTAGHTDFITDETIETRNFAELAYEFAVDGKSYRGSRVDLSPDRGNVEVTETLKRYPQGAIVTVFYDPNDPAQCILERDDPANLRAAWHGVAVLAALIVAGVLGIDRLAEAVRGLIAQPKRTPLVMALGLFAVVIALFAHMLGRKRREMRSWTRTTGRIVQSTIEATLRTRTRAAALQSRTSQTIYVPRIVYQYDAGGISLQGDNIGATSSGGTPAIAARYVARFPVDAAIVVFFNPHNPVGSTLDPGGVYVELAVWAIAGTFAAAALVAAGLEPRLIER